MSYINILLLSKCVLYNWTLQTFYQSFWIASSHSSTSSLHKLSASVIVGLNRIKWQPTVRAVSNPGYSRNFLSLNLYFVYPGLRCEQPCIQSETDPRKPTWIPLLLRFLPCLKILPKSTISEYVAEVWAILIPSRCLPFFITLPNNTPS